MKLSLIISLSNTAPKPPADTLSFGNSVELTDGDGFDATLDALIRDITNYRDTIRKVACLQKLLN